MGMVDYDFYSNVYKGEDADETSFPTLCARASDVISAVTHWRVDENTISTFHERIQTLVKKAVCAQVDSLSINGMDSLNESASAGFTVGKVTVHAKAGASASGRLAESISPMAMMYLEQTGLMNPNVPAIDGW